MTRPRPPRYIYRIRYRRPGGEDKYRYRFDEAAVRRFVRRITEHNDPAILPTVTFVEVQRCELADEWIDVPLENVGQLGMF